MANVAEVLDQLAAGRLTVDEVVDDFRSRHWPATRRPTLDEAHLGAEPPVTDRDSWDTVNADSRLTSDVYARLADAYRHATLAK